MFYEALGQSQTFCSQSTAADRSHGKGLGSLRKATERGQRGALGHSSISKEKREAGVELAHETEGMTYDIEGKLGQYGIL